MGKIAVVPASPEDAKELLALYAPYVQHTAITFEYTIPSVEEFEERIRHTLQRYPYLKALEDGKIVGYAYVGPFHDRAAYDWAVETSIYVAEDRKRAGIGCLLYTELERYLKAQGILNLNACIATPSPDEDEYLTFDSVRFHVKLGYRMVGEFQKCGYKFGRWYNMVWMEKIIGKHLDAQPPVKTFAEVLAQEQA